MFRRQRKAKYNDDVPRLSNIETTDSNYPRLAKELFVEGTALRSTLKRLGLFLGILFALVLVGTVGFMLVQKLSFFDAFYFTVCTITTVSYGDIVPQTTAAKLLAISLIVAGVGTFTAAVVTSIQFLSERRDRERHTLQIHTLMSLYFGEVGNRLLRIFSSWDPGLAHILAISIEDGAPSDVQFNLFAQEIKKHVHDIDPARINLPVLDDFLTKKSSFLLRLMESDELANLDNFGRLLRATFHLKDELGLRASLSDLPPGELQHIANDAKEVYVLASNLWLEHARYMKRIYPHLFNIALKENPFKRSNEESQVQ
jgi:uncharacterized membrane protein